MSKKKQRLKRDMIRLYGLVWGNDLWVPGTKNILTMHHCHPVRSGGRLTWDNIALLSLYFHDLFNRIEQVDQKLADELNDLFRDLNKSMQPPKEQHYNDVVFITDKAEYKY